MKLEVEVMNIFDVVILLAIALGGVVGLKRGVLKELVVVIGTILVFFLAFILKDYLAAFLCTNLPFFHFASSLGGLNSLSIIFYQLISFLIIVIILLFLLRILIRITGFVSKIVDATIILALPNKILGFIVGLIEGYIIVFLALNILAIPLNGNADFANSNLREFIMNDTPVLSDSFGGINHALDDILSLEGQDVDTNNLTVIDTLLKYKVVSVDFVEELVDTGKLQDVDGLDAVLDKYR